MFNRTNALILVIAIAGAALGFLAGGWIRPMHEPAQRLMLAGSQAGVLQNIRFLTEGMPGVF